MSIASSFVRRSIQAPMTSASASWMPLFLGLGLGAVVVVDFVTFGVSIIVLALSVIRQPARVLQEAGASVVYGEAILSMQTEQHKGEIVAEAARVLRSGGRCGIHELALEPDALSEELKQEIQQALSGPIHIGARPLTPSEWRILLEERGLQVELEVSAPMHLLEPRRLLRDEGVAGTTSPCA